MAARVHFERGNTVIPSDNITGTGTVNQLAKFTAPNVIGDSLLFDNGTSVNNTGAGNIVTNTAFGTDALISNTTGLDNVAIGCRSLEDNTTGVNNAAVGKEAGRFIADGINPNNTGSQNVFIGTDTKANADGDTNEIVIGYNAIGNGTNSVVLGNDDIASTELKGNVTISSYTEGALSTTNTGLIQLEPTFKNLSFGESYANLKTEDYLTNGFFVNPTDVGYQYAKLIQSDLLNKSSILLIPQATKESVLGVNRGADLDVVRATTATRVNSDGLIEEVAINVPRIDYTGGGCGKLLLEPQRTNLALFSEQFDNAHYNKTNSTITPNTIVSPDGFTNADTYTATGAGNAIDFTATSVGSNTVTYSVFVKKGTNDIFRIREAFYFGTSVTFNLTNGTITSGTGTITEYNNDWYRCTFTQSYGVGQTALTIAFDTTVSSGTFHLYGAQTEVGSYPTSYIPTLGAAVTRSADAASKTGISALIGQTEGTLFAEFTYNGVANSGVYEIILELATDANNVITINKNNITSELYVFSRVGGVIQVNSVGIAGTNILGTHKVALAYNLNDYVCFLDGVQVFTDTSATVPTCSAVFVGDGISGTQQLGGGIAQTLLFKTRLTNAELETLTTL